MKQLFPLLVALAILIAGCRNAPIEGSLESTTQSPPPTTTETTSEPTTYPTETTVSNTVAPDPVLMILNSMTLEEKVGQIFLAGSVGGDLSEDIRVHHPGGYIFFGTTFQNQTPDSIKSMLSRLQQTSKIPLLFADDEEGGTVVRVSRFPAFRSERFPSPRTSYSKGGLPEVLLIESEKAALLSSLGLNVIMGPVCDITTSPESFMYKRSLGQDPEITADFASQTVSVMAQHHMGSVLKHFPGYGNNQDTHTGIAVDHRPLEELQATDLIPFQEGIAAGCDAILVSHTIITCLDDTNPATLSPAVHDYLRNIMGFEGVIMTDDLQMGAITALYGDAEAAVLAILAGNDLLCVSEYHTQYSAVLDAVKSGRIDEAILDAAVIRILRLKMELGLISSP